MKKPRTPDPSQPKRSRGRPVGGAEQGVGRDGLIAAARRLLAVETPSKVTTAAIAREAGVDPALVRYHFGDRQHLLLAVVEEMLRNSDIPRAPAGATAAERLARQARMAMHLARSARSMQRLMVEELASAKSPEIRARISALNANAINSYASLFNRDQPDALAPADPLFVFIALIGMAEFFVTAEPIIRPQVPAGTDMDELSERFADFMAKLFVKGLRPE